MGVRARPEHVLVPAESLGAEVVQVDRGGDVTYHGPGQLVGYPIRRVATKRGGGMADTAAHVFDVEQLIIDALADLGLPGCGRIRGLAGVWVDPLALAGRSPARRCGLQHQARFGNHPFRHQPPPAVGL